MRLLVIAWYFPPTNTIAAVRLGKLCRYLLRHGHEVRVVSARGLPFQQNLPLGIPRDHVRYTDWGDLPRLPNRLLAGLSGFFRRANSHQSSNERESGMSTATPPGRVEASSLNGRALRWLKDSLAGALSWPDKQIGWLPYALRAGGDILREWPADLIYASAPPFTTCLIGYRLARRAGVPWVAELRDRWSDDPYYPPLAWLLGLHRMAERFLLRRVMGIVTVSEPWAKTYRAKYTKPVQVVYNGYDADEAVDGTRVLAPVPPDTLRIVYTGGIYPGRRDPSPLFAALKLLAEELPLIRVDFFGTAPDMVLPLAAKFGMEAAIKVHPGLPHELAIAEQRRADILLLMQWNDPKEQGNVPGKFFEYLGARRPILLLGLEDGVPATLLRERGAGVCINQAEEIARQLRTWYAMKQENGAIPLLPEDARAGFARDEQYAKLEVFLLELLANTSTKAR